MKTQDPVSVAHTALRSLDYKFERFDRKVLGPAIPGSEEWERQGGFLRR